jgi:UDPglucose 6-dehydrogenase
MRVGLIGLGKLGLPVAVAMATEHAVTGYDINPSNMVLHRPYPHRELGPNLYDNFQDYYEMAGIVFAGSVGEVVASSELVFVAVQTPHAPQFEGVTRVPEDRADFDYSHLVTAIGEVAKHVRPDQVVVVISTVLPGTMRREVLPLLKGRAALVYNPFFAAMGTVVHDVLNPEFVLIGGDEPWAVKKVRRFYKELLGRDLSAVMSVESAELTKVAYNLFVSFKIGFANTLMEICHKIPGCDVDDVTSALGRATKRLISANYMRGGMGDGGNCHPRDAIAMSWLADELDLSYNMFDEVMSARERQAEWLVTQLLWYDMPVVILGLAYKPESNSTAGSAAVLCSTLLTEKGVAHQVYDPLLDPGHPPPLTRAVYLIGTKHEVFRAYEFPPGSVVIDPFRYIPPRPGVCLVPVGVGPEVK